MYCMAIMFVYFMLYTILLAVLASYTYITFDPFFVQYFYHSMYLITKGSCFAVYSKNVKMHKHETDIKSIDRSLICMLTLIN